MEVLTKLFYITKRFLTCCTQLGQGLERILLVGALRVCKTLLLAVLSPVLTHLALTDGSFCATGNLPFPERQALHKEFHPMLIS